MAISVVNVELTSHCNKNCHMCGRRKLEKQNPNYTSTLGDMPITLVRKTAHTLPEGTIVQLHWNGEPTLYPQLEDAASLFHDYGHYTFMNTNGLLIGREDRYVLEALKFFCSITVSVIEGDSESNYELQNHAVEVIYGVCNGDIKAVVRALGKVPEYFKELSKKYDNVEYVTRQFHAPEMSRDYEVAPVKPEYGVCLDLMTHLAIDRFGDVYPCVRMNPKGFNKLGNIAVDSFIGLEYSRKRTELINKHQKGRRNECDLCKDCHYWGIPRGRD